MRTCTKLFIAGCLLVSIALFSEAKKPDFSGKWKLNSEKSVSGEGGGWMTAAQLTIAQTDDKLSIERLLHHRSGEEYVAKEELTLDGKECKNTVGERQKSSVAAWSEDGKSITITSKMTFERDGNTREIDTVEIIKLADDGNSLFIDTTSKSSRGERKLTVVYDKEQATK